jgi:hypothetical protein
MSSPVGFRKARGIGVKKGLVFTTTITGLYVPGGVTITPGTLRDIDHVIGVEVMSGLGAAAGVMHTKAVSINTTRGSFKLEFYEEQSGVALPASGYAVSQPLVELASGRSISGTTVRYFAIGE